MTSTARSPAVPSSFAIHILLWLMLWSVMSGCYVEAPPAGPDVMSAQLGELLADPDPDMRRTAAEALGKIGRRSSRAGLILALNDREARVRAAATLSLGRLGDAESGPVLVQSLSDPAETVRVAAALALSEIDPSPSCEALILATLRYPEISGRIAASQALLGLDTISFSDDLVRALRDSDPMIRQAVAAVLGETGDVRIVPHLLSLLRKDAVAGVRSEAAFRLGKIGDDRVMADLVKVAEADSDLVVRGWARWARQQIKQSHESGSGIRPSR